MAGESRLSLERVDLEDGVASQWDVEIRPQEDPPFGRPR
jgi:hypothetical protein